MIRYRLTTGALLATGVLFAPAAVQAQETSEAELDALIDASQTSTGALERAAALEGQGDLTGAAAALERALLVDPNASAARLHYAALLCRLDDAQGARVEMAKLDGQAIDDAAFGAANAACGGQLARPAPAQGGDDSGLTGELWAGLGYDGDALGPIAVQFDLPPIPVRQADGLSFIAGARFAGKSEGYRSGAGGVYGGAAVQAKHDISGPAQRYELGEIRLGYGRSGDGTDFEVGTVFRHARIFNNPYVSEYGGQVRVGFQSGEKGRIVLRGEAVRQDYELLGPGRAGEGMRYDIGLSYEARTAIDGWFAVGIAAELKDARARAAGYRGARAWAAYQTPLGEKGAYFNLSTTLRTINFRNNPPVLDRRDTRAFARAAVGVPLGASGFVLEGALSYTLRNVGNRVTASPPPAFVARIADYSSVGAEVRLKWKF